jgi:HAD superfamily hydrolase (TIGR01549 family)
MKYQAVVFDMDGVLINSKKCMNLCWNKVQEITKIKIEFSNYFSKIGKPFNVILSELGLPQESWNEIEKIYFQAQEYYVKEIKPYAGVEDMLIELKKDYVLGLVTSKGSKAVDLILNRFGWNFSQVITPDNCARGKPYPDPLLYFTAYEQIPPNNCIYVGDMFVDMKAAELAGFDFIRAGWGYQDFAAQSVETPNELIELIGKSK